VIAGARRVLDNLAVVRRRQIGSRGRKRVHAMNKISGKLLCSRGPRDSALVYHEIPELSEVNCVWCLDAIDALERVARGE